MCRATTFCCLGILCSCLLVGCSEEPIPPELSFDEQIEQEWMNGRQRVNAVSFLSGGGVYEDTSPDLQIDQVYLLPLLKKLQDELGLTVDALLDSEQIAFAIVVELPADQERPKIVTALDEADRSMPGLIHDFWGEHWLSIDVLDQNEVRAMEQTGQLELLRKHLRAHREMVRKSAQ